MSYSVVARHGHKPSVDPTTCSDEEVAQSPRNHEDDGSQNGTPADEARCEPEDRDSIGDRYLSDSYRFGVVPGDRAI